MNEQRLMNVLLAPHVSEKTTLVGEQANQYVFRVDRTATKPEIKAAVEKLFNVSVEGVRVVNQSGKNKMFRFRAGRRPHWKKAYVRVAEGQTIDVLGAE